MFSLDIVDDDVACNPCRHGAVVRARTEKVVFAHFLLTFWGVNRESVDSAAIISTNPHPLRQIFEWTFPDLPPLFPIRCADEKLTRKTKKRPYLAGMGTALFFRLAVLGEQGWPWHRQNRQEDVWGEPGAAFAFPQEKTSCSGGISEFLL